MSRNTADQARLVPPLTLEDLCRSAAAIGTTPGFVPGAAPIMGSKSTSEFFPKHWSYSQVKLELVKASGVLDPKYAERRTLVLKNPKPGNDWATSRTLVCAYQMILPGEVAPSHRHSSHALRVILEATGTYSVVNGERMPMETGDVVLTPANCWHAHGHDGNEPAFWLDGLDVPLTYLLEPMYFENHPAKIEPVTRVTSRSPFRFAWADSQRLLAEASTDPAGVHGRRIILAAPDLPAIQIALERLDASISTRPKRSTANRIFCVMEGEGKTQVGDFTFAWSRGDTFVAPFWNFITHQAAVDSVLCELSDQKLMEYMKSYREETNHS